MIVTIKYGIDEHYGNCLCIKYTLTFLKILKKIYIYINTASRF